MSAVDVLGVLDGAQRYAGAHLSKMSERGLKAQAKAAAKGVVFDKSHFEGELAADRARYVVCKAGEARDAVAELLAALNAYEIPATSSLPRIRAIRAAMNRCEGRP